MPKIGLINYDSGNLQSVSKALQKEGAEVRLVGSPEEFDGCDAIVLPGVGAFSDSVRSLKARKLWEPLAAWLAANRPFLGICLGYQLLFESSEESPDDAGFGIFKGRVVHFQDTPGRKIPHMGWNTVEPTTPDEDIWKGLPASPHVFFVHSYYPVPADDAIISSRCTYDETFAASVCSGNIRATQFHPEKSQDVGLTILRNFIQTV